MLLNKNIHKDANEEMLSDIRNYMSPILNIATLIKLKNPSKDPKDIVIIKETLKDKEYVITLDQIFNLAECMKEENYKK